MTRVEAEFEFDKRIGRERNRTWWSTRWDEFKKIGNFVMKNFTFLSNLKVISIQLPYGTNILLFETLRCVIDVGHIITTEWIIYVSRISWLNTGCTWRVANFEVTWIIFVWRRRAPAFQFEIIFDSDFFTFYEILIQKTIHARQKRMTFTTFIFL